jgi:cellulose biosynthesis protein BcsQ
VVGTTTSIHLAAYLQSKGETLLIDGDPNRSASGWAKRGELTFKVVDERQAAKQKLTEKPTQPNLTETTESKKMGRPKGKRSDPDYEQVTAYIKSGTYTNVKIELLKEGQKREFSELIQELLDDWLNLRS